MIGAIALLSIAGLLLLAALGLAVQTVLRRRAWDETEAEILESSIEAFTDQKNVRKFRGMFLLRYRALNDMREALVRSGTSSTDRKVIAAYVEARPIGTRVRIHFDPHAPGQVATNFTSGVVAFSRAGAAALAGLGIAVLGAAMLYLAQSPEW